MGDQDSRGSVWTSLPGILGGAAALITAISGLAVWQHNQPKKPVNPRPAIVQAERPAAGKETVGKGGQGGSGGQEAQGNSGIAKSAATQPTAAPVPGEQGSRPWCDQQVAEWSAKMAQGTDDAGIRKTFREGKCGQYGLRLGKPQAKP